MDLLHLEYNGKTAKIPVRALPAKYKPNLTYKTSFGKINSVLLKSGINDSLKTEMISFDFIVNEDPEIKLETAGEAIDKEALSPTYFNPTLANPVPESDFKFTEIIFTPENIEKERRELKIRSSNINEITPVKVGRMIPITEALTSFVFKNCFQLVHEDGLMRDFLYTLAEKLYTEKSVAVLGAGPKGNMPLVFRDKGNPYRTFLFGDIGGENNDSYKLLLLLSDQELKTAN